MHAIVMVITGEVVVEELLEDVQVRSAEAC